MCPYGSGIRGIARVHLPESYSLLPSITGQPCIAHICARAFRISSFSFPRAVRQLCFFPLPSERKKEISFLREISSSKIHLFVKSIGKGGRVISSLPFQQTATNHRKARYKRSALVLLGYLSKHAANISSSITFSTYLLPPPWNVILLYTQLIALGEKRDKSFVQEGKDNRNWKVDNLENEAERPRGLGAKQPGPRETWQTNNNSLRGKHVERCNSTRQLCRFYYGQNRQSFGTRLSLSLSFSKIMNSGQQRPPRPIRD